MKASRLLLFAACSLPLATTSACKGEPTPDTKPEAKANADHTGFTEASLMYMNPQIGGVWSDNVRVTGPGYPNHDYDVLADAVYGGIHGAAWVVPPGPAPLGLLGVQTTAHALIAANASLIFNPR